MGKPAARMGDSVLQTAPHCHAPIHPPAPVPTSVAHPALQLPIVGPSVPNVLIGRQPAAVVGDLTVPCLLPGCVPGGPGTLVQGSSSVTIGKRPAVRVSDATAHLVCVGPIAAPVGEVLPPGCPTVMIGG